MPLWLFLLLVVGGLLVIGLVYDGLNKRKKRRLSLDSKSSSSLDDAYDPRDRDGEPF